MKKILFLFCCMVTAIGAVPAPIDSLIALIYYPGGEETISLSDVSKSDLYGQTQSFTQVAMRKIEMIHAEKELKIPWTDEDAEREFARIQKDFKLTREQLGDFFSEMGYTLEEAAAMLKEKNLVQQSREHHMRTSAKLVIDKSDVETYYKDHPEKTPAKIELHDTVVPFSQAPDSEDLEHLFSSDEAKKLVPGASFFIAPEDLPQGKESIMSEKPGHVVTIERGPDGWIVTQLVRVIEPEVLPLDTSRYEAIANMLSQERMIEVQRAYQKKLLDSVKIKIFDPAFKLDL